MKSKRKSKKSSKAKCKGGFPKTHLCIKTSLLICRGLAKKYQYRISGRRNAFGGMIGRRTCAWESGTAPAFAVLFRSNTHTLPNFRAPVLPETHDHDFCKSVACIKSMDNPKELKNMAKMAQRACRECCGYHSGYTFKSQPIGAKYLAAAAETLNYVTDKLDSKDSAAKKYNYMSHRVLQDLQHRCMTRVAPEEWNLAANWHEQDIMNAEFVRTYRSHDFPGGALVRRVEAESSAAARREIRKPLPALSAETLPEQIYLRCFDDIYGFRGPNAGWSREIFYLSPWEFLMWWECIPLPNPKNLAKSRKGISLSIWYSDIDYGPNVDAEDAETIFFKKDIPGGGNLHARWYLRKRRRLMIPAPNNTPMPEREKDIEKKSRLYSLYMRPWTLMPEWSTPQVPHITDLNVIPCSDDAAPVKRRRLKSKTAPQHARSFYCMAVGS